MEVVSGAASELDVVTATVVVVDVCSVVLEGEVSASTAQPERTSASASDPTFVLFMMAPEYGHPLVPQTLRSGLLSHPMFSIAAAVFSVILVVTGVSKMIRPADVDRAIRQLGVKSFPNAGFMLGVLEFGVGVGALFFAPLLAAQAVIYLAFVVWLAFALRLDVPIASCGCLGRPDTPPTRAHLGFNVVGMAVSGLAVSSPLSLGSGFEAVAQVSLIAVGAFLAYVLLSDGARLEGVRAK